MPLAQGQEWQHLRARMRDAVSAPAAAGIFNVYSWTRQWERALNMAAQCAFVSGPVRAVSSSVTTARAGEEFVMGHLSVRA